jgi:hypothetical protein
VLYPVCLLGGALVLSVTAQLAVAKPGFFGGLVSVIPALAFAALAKLILGKAPATATVEDEPTPAPSPVPVPVERPRPVPAVPVPVPVPVVPAVPASVLPVPAVEVRPEVGPEPVPAEAVPAVVPAPVEAIAEPSRSTWPTAPLPPALLDTARDAAARFAAEHGRQIRRDELRQVLRVSNSTTGDVMAALGLTTPRTPVTAVNGTPAPGLF